MDVSVENTSNLGRRMTVTVPFEQLEQEIKTRLSKMRKTARVEGFRPGKADIRVLEQLYGATVRSEAVGSILKTTLNEALTQEKLKPAGTPTIQELKTEKNQPIEYVATFEIFPEIQVQSLADVILEKYEVTIEDEDVNRVLEQMRKQHATWKVVDRAAVMGDRLTIDLTWLDKDPNQKRKDQKNVTLLLMKESLPPELEVLIGTKAGDEIQAQMPVYIPNATEKTVAAAMVKIHSVAEAELPEIDEEFAKRLDVKGGSNALRSEVREHMAQQLEHTIKTKLRDQLVKKLLERHSFELPQELVDTEMKQIEHEVIAQQVKQGVSAEAAKNLLAGVQADIAHQAKQRVTLSLLYATLIKDFGLKVDFGKVRARIEQYASVFNDPASVVRKMLQEQETVNRVSSQVLEEQVIERLLEQVQYTEKKIEYAKFMEIGKEEQMLE